MKLNTEIYHSGIVVLVKGCFLEVGKIGDVFPEKWYGEVIELFLGYDYLQPIPLHLDALGFEELVVEAQSWRGVLESLSKCLFFLSSKNGLCQTKSGGLEAWQVSSGLKVVCWPLAYLQRYPRSAYLSGHIGE